MYKRVWIETDPRIMGVRNGVYQVELKENKSFVSKEEKDYYESYFASDINAFLLEGFKKINEKRITCITYFPLKGARETDFIVGVPHERGIDFLVTEKCLDVLESFKLPTYNKFKVNIEGFSSNYFAVGFPMVPNHFVDYSNSIFVDLATKERIQIADREEYKKSFSIGDRKIAVKYRLDYDIIAIQPFGLFFSEKLINAIEMNRLIGLQIEETEMILE